jgi:translation initiation factor IF-1
VLIIVTKQQDQLVLDGVVIESLPGAMFRIKITEEMTVLGHISGKMRQNKIQILVGDRVQVEFSPYDLQRGRIIYRSK